MSDEKTTKRPTGITLLAVFYILCACLVFISGLLLFFAGAVAALAWTSEPGVMVDALFTPVLFSICIGTFASAIALGTVAYGLLRGKKWARLGTLVLCGLNLCILLTLFISIIFLNVVYPLDLLLQILLIYYMFTPKVESFLSN